MPESTKSTRILTERLLSNVRDRQLSAITKLLFSYLPYPLLRPPDLVFSWAGDEIDFDHSRSASI